MIDQTSLTTASKCHGAPETNLLALLTPFLYPIKICMGNKTKQHVGIKTKERKRDHGEGMWKGWDKGERAQKVYRVQKV
ncbi:hypothetical protein VTJ04DRAFT_5166 [Mycothermus thermophilus]|uniref:uncharacterized protein n=1 Tax=Humicola insolens TaxID=85995 RepID=UPI0037432E2C